MENNQYVYIIDAIIFYHDSVAEAQYVDQVVASMIPEIISQGSVYNQIKYVHDFICNLVEYDGERINVNGYDEYKYDSSYNCLVDRKAVCTGYSLLFQKFMEQLGIPSFVLANDVHMWNTVNYDGVWYLMDVTWDDTDQGIIYDYFLSGLDWNHQSVTNLPLSQIKHIFF